MDDDCFETFISVTDGVTLSPGLCRLDAIIRWSWKIYEVKSKVWDDQIEKDEEVEARQTDGEVEGGICSYIDMRLVVAGDWGISSTLLRTLEECGFSFL